MYFIDADENERPELDTGVHDKYGYSQRMLEMKSQLTQLSNSNYKTKVREMLWQMVK